MQTQIKMSRVVVLLFFLCQVGANDNPNNYFDFSINLIKETLIKKISVTYYDVVILKTHINVNSKYVQNAIGEEIERLITQKEDLKCRQFLAQLEKKTLEDCRMESDFESLDAAKNKFNQLNEVACLTEELCQELNPFGIGVEKCQLSKIADLQLQIIVVNEEFEKLKKKLFEDHDRCVRQSLNSAFSELADVVFKNCKK